MTALLTTSYRALQLFLKLCEKYADQFSVVFSTTKPRFFSSHPGNLPLGRSLNLVLKAPKFVAEWSHSGHKLRVSSEDKTVIFFRRNLFCRKINNVLTNSLR